VEYAFHLSDELWPVTVDPDQMREVFLNVITNAAEAMEGGGRLTVVAENVGQGAGAGSETREPKAGKFVKISITDQGLGIRRENLEKVFDPYYSTKERGTQKGMGLGLTIVHSIVSKHDGFVQIASAPNAGTTFYIYLPAAESIPAAAGSIEKAAAALDSGCA